MRREDLLDLNEALQYPGRILEFDISTELENEADLELLEPVAGTLEAVSTGNILLLKSTFRTRGTTGCARCGKPIETDIEFKMEDEFPIEGTPSSFGSASYAKIAPDEPHPLFVENSLICDDYIRQGLLLNAPIQPLCSGSWDKPCPDGPPQSSNEFDEGHPAFQALKGLRDEETSP